MTELNLSHYRPTPDQRRFSISSFAVTGQIEWRAKPGGEFEARLEVFKGALARMIPFQAMEASVRVEHKTLGDNQSAQKIFSSRTISGRSADELKTKTWTDLSVISAIELPWVAEYALQRRNVGGPAEVYFNFEDNQRVRTAILNFRNDPDLDLVDALADLRVLRPDESPSSVSTIRLADSRPGDVLVTFRNAKVSGFTVFVPVIGKLQFVSH